MRPVPAAFSVAGCLLLGGCLPHDRRDPGLEREREEVLRMEKEHPEDPRYPQARYAICLKMAETVSVESTPPLPLSERVRGRVSAEGGLAGPCCLGGLAFLADVLVVTPLRALRSVFTMPVAWARRSSLQREAEAARRRWQALERPEDP